MKFSRVFILLITLVLATSCGGKKRLFQILPNENKRPRKFLYARGRRFPKRYTDVVQNYISEFSAIAQEEMRLYKIPASITLAQGILESGAGVEPLPVRPITILGLSAITGKGIRYTMMMIYPRNVLESTMTQNFPIVIIPCF